MTYPEHPTPLLALTGSKWEIPDEASSVLENISDTITAVSIVGKYRGGKSYLMNVIGGKPGFDTGATVQAQTKGIWMWPVKHPKEEGRCLLLLDTEGLHDAAMGDSNHDMQLFVFALLMSNCIIYNIKGNLDTTLVAELQMVAELTNHIKVQNGASNAEEGKEQALQSHIPELVIVVRDFHLKLELDGKLITPAEYLESILESKEGAVKEYNTQRECIRQYFQHRTCFTLPKPVQDDSKIKNLAKLPKEELSEEFVKNTDKLVEYILTNIKTMTADNLPLFSPGFLAILKTYVDAVNDNGVPCIESAFESMKRQEGQRALDKAFKIYLEGLKDILKGNLPIETAELVSLHTDCKEQAVEEYRRIVKIVKIEEKAIDLNEMIEKEFQTFSSENDKESILKSETAISECFETVTKTLATDRYYQKGGHAAFKKDLEDAQSKYNSRTSLGPMKDDEWSKKMSNMSTAEVAIMKSDKALTEKEKEAAEIEEKLQAQQAEAKRRENELEDRKLQIEKDLLHRTEIFEKDKKDMEEKAEKEMKKHQEELESMKNEISIMQEKGFNEQADKMQARVKVFEEEGQRMRAESEKKTEAMERARKDLLTNHQEKMEKLTREQNDLLEKEQAQQRDHLKEMTERERKLEKEIEDMKKQSEEQMTVKQRELEQVRLATQATKDVLLVDQIFQGCRSM